MAKPCSVAWELRVVFCMPLSQANLNALPRRHCQFRGEHNESRNASPHRIHNAKFLRVLRAKLSPLAGLCQSHVARRSGIGSFSYTGWRNCDWLQRSTSEPADVTSNSHCYRKFISAEIATHEISLCFKSIVNAPSTVSCRTKTALPHPGP